MILDQYFGWFLVLEIMFLMIVTKFFARNDKSKKICRRFSELFEKIHNPNSGGQDVENLHLIDQNYLVKDNSVFMFQLRSRSHLMKTQMLNSGICVLSCAIFAALGILFK